ncbi:MAG: glycosyltransferase [Hyellaceae cyanobacterium CSU_1_1]|nr:glycosyltransferase [Hyellaceae cyanobacterium CSU_1_1]
MSLKLPTVSIIVDAYEGISYLPATLDSILQQTNGNFEILVFSDDYRQIHTWFRRQPDTRLKFTVQSNLGLATTLNRGVLEAQGKYISFVRAGDLWHPNKLEQQLFCFDRYPEVALIHSGSLLLDHQHPSRQNTAPIGYCSQNRSFARTTMINPFKNLFQPPEILSQNQLNLSSVMLRRSCFEMVGLFNPQLQIIPDWEMWIRLSNHYQFMAIAEPLVYCRQFPEHQSNCLTLETDLQTIIETVYANLSSQLEQKYRSYGFASLFLAQNTLQTKNPDLAIVRNYWYQALMHNPLIIFSLEFCQLRWTIFRRYLRLYCRQQYQQSDRYCHLLQLIQNTSRFKITIDPTRHRQNFNWMLESEEGSN